MTPTCYHLSASSIAAFKACPTRFRLGYREGIRTAVDTESQRVGTNWHEVHETYARVLALFPDANGYAEVNGSPVSPEHSVRSEFALTAVIELLNERYANCPQSIDSKDWALERTILLTCFIGYLWYYANDPVEVFDSEVPFELPLKVPRVNMPLPTSEVVRVGKIDHIIRWQGMVGALERKSTSRSIAAESDYWETSRKDTQVSMYALAFRDMIVNEQLGEIHYSRPNGETRSVGNTLYDVWHRPTIKPKMLTQADTAAFIETGKYQGQKFAVATGVDFVEVNEETADIEQGKKSFAIRETVTMFGARLLADIQERPDFYFVRREIARTDQDLERFERQLFAVYQSQKLAEKHNAWVENEKQCRATFPCPYIPICYGPGADAVCDGKTTPAGFKRIFVDLKVNGQEREAE